MDQQQQATVLDVLLSLVPADGSTVGNQALRLQFLAAAPAAGFAADDVLFNTLRETLVGQGVLEKGKGRGGSLRRVAMQQGFSLGVPELTSPKAAKLKIAGKVNKSAAKQSTGLDAAQIISYRHLDRRKNNPEVGVVTSATDPDAPKTVWNFDPYLEPALQF